MSTKRYSTVFLLLAAWPTAAQPGQEPSRQNTEQIVRQYILEHPEILIESLRLYQAREATARRERSEQAIPANLTDLQKDPSSPAAGPADAVTVVEFFDYRCGYCKRAESAVLKLLADHPEVRFVFKEFPILGPDSSLWQRANKAAT